MATDGQRGRNEINIFINVICGRNARSAKLEVSLLGVGTALRLGKGFVVHGQNTKASNK